MLQSTPVTNSTKLSLSFSVAAVFFLAVGVASIFLIDHINQVLEDVAFYNLQLGQAAETMTDLRLHPAQHAPQLARLDDLSRLARTEIETTTLAKARQAIESGATAQAIANLEQVSDYYRKAAGRAHEALVIIHQQFINGIVLMMGAGTVLLAGMMVLVRRWFIGPLFDVHEAIHLTIANDPAHPVPQNELRELMSPVSQLVDKVKELEERTARTERLAMAGEACTRVGQNLRNLVTSMRLTAQNARSEETMDPKTKAALDSVTATANAMDRWVTNLVNASRPLELKACRQSVEMVVRDSVSLLQPLLVERDIRVDVEAAESVPDAVLDRPLFEQALVAVLKNAMDASPDESRVVVEVTGGSDGVVMVAITDEGEGMTEDVRSRACDPFFTKRKDGVGMGLTHVQRIVELHGGKLRIESQLRTGTSVYIALPADVDAASQAKMTPPAATAQPASKSGLAALIRR